MYRNLSHHQKLQSDSYLGTQLQAQLEPLRASEEPHEADQDRASQNRSPQSWITAFNTSLLTTQARDLNRDSQTGHSDDLGALMQSPEFHALIIAAQHLAQTQGCSKEVATERLIDAFRRLDRGWERVVLTRGLNTLISKNT